MKSPLSMDQQKVLVAFARIAERASETALWDELKELCNSPQSINDVLGAVKEAEPLWAVDLGAAQTHTRVQATQTRLEWEDAVFEAMCELGEVTRSDAQGIVEAKEIQGGNPLGEAWKAGLTAPRAARKMLDMEEDPEQLPPSFSNEDILTIKRALEDLMRAIVRAGQRAGIIRDDLESVSAVQCVHILDLLSSEQPSPHGR